MNDRSVVIGQLEKDIKKLNSLRNLLTEAAMDRFFKKDFAGEKVFWKEIMKVEEEIDEKQQLRREMIIRIHREAIDDFKGTD